MTGASGGIPAACWMSLGLLEEATNEPGSFAPRRPAGVVATPQDTGQRVVHGHDGRDSGYQARLIHPHESAKRARETQRRSGLQEQLMRVVDDRHVAGHKRLHRDEAGQIVRVPGGHRAASLHGGSTPGAKVLQVPAKPACTAEQRAHAPGGSAKNGLAERGNTEVRVGRRINTRTFSGSPSAG